MLRKSIVIEETPLSISSSLFLTPTPTNKLLHLDFDSLVYESEEVLKEKNELKEFFRSIIEEISQLRHLRESVVTVICKAKTDNQAGEVGSIELA